MSPEERDALLSLVLHPPAGSKLAAAKDFGVDLTLLLSALELTPVERARRLSLAASFFDEVRIILKGKASAK